MDGLLNTLKFVHRMSADIKFVCSSVQNWSIKCGGCFYDGSYQGDVGYQNINLMSPLYELM
jgi:hypothetical protein